MVDSKRATMPGHAMRTGKAEKAQTFKERMFLVTFALGGISLVTGMFWIADGLSDNFKTTTVTFILFAVTGGLTIASSITSRVMAARILKS